MQVAAENALDLRVAFDNGLEAVGAVFFIEADFVHDHADEGIRISGANTG